VQVHRTQPATQQRQVGGIPVPHPPSVIMVVYGLVLVPVYGGLPGGRGGLFAGRDVGLKVNNLFFVKGFGGTGL
jgi:hypothetical protein